jgi:hypothetical protein
MEPGRIVVGAAEAAALLAAVKPLAAVLDVLGRELWVGALLSAAPPFILLAIRNPPDVRGHSGRPTCGRAGAGHGKPP